jgi:hypothetical protein
VDAMILIGSGALLTIGSLILLVQVIQIVFSLLKIIYYLLKAAVCLVIITVCTVALAIQYVLRLGAQQTRLAADVEPVVTIIYSDDDADIYDLPRTHFRRL